MFIWNPPVMGGNVYIVLDMYKHAHFVVAVYVMLR